MTAMLVRDETLLNCGHASERETEVKGYTMCPECAHADAISAVETSDRVAGYLVGMRVETALGVRLGTVVERVENGGARTPTGGRYVSVRMTVRAGGHKWFANGPKDGSSVITLRKAGK